MFGKWLYYAICLHFIKLNCVKYVFYAIERGQRPKIPPPTTLYGIYPRTLSVRSQDV